MFKEEAQDLQPDYTPKDSQHRRLERNPVGLDRALPTAVLILCFLHAWLSIRDRAKHMGAAFVDLSHRVWEAYHAPTRSSFAQRLRRLREFASRTLSGIVLDKTLKLCKKRERFAQAYQKPGCHRTSNMLDRLMREMVFLRRSASAWSFGVSRLHGRAWALLWNFAPWSPASTRANQGWQCPAARLNRHQYHDNWLQNLLISASLDGYHNCRQEPQNP